ncbi:MAG: peptidoglycan-binding protein [Alkalinema sp. CAN_BIN05]|nr:peptidoglycan-binding protein [Alkalinema sp. CAN_BIN05]
MSWKPPYSSLFFTILLTIVPALPGVLPGVLPAQASRPLLKLGSQGVDVLEVQALLQLLGYYGGELDGTYTDNTERAVTEFQKSAGLGQDGILGISTWSKLLPAVPQSTNSATIVKSDTQTKPAPQPLKPDIKKPDLKSNTKSEESRTPILRRGAKGNAVYRLQQRLGTLGFLAIGPDGDFGELTEKAVKSAQQKYNLEADGVVGGATWNAIGL